MKAKEYSKKYKIAYRAVYKHIYAGRIRAERSGGNWDVSDSPISYKKRNSNISNMPEYALAILWYTASISGDAILIRNSDRYFADIVSQFIKGSMWQAERKGRAATWIFKISSIPLVRELRGMGFTGRNDAGKRPPPVAPMIAAQALCETHGLLSRQIRYRRGHSGDKQYATYVQKFGVCGSEAIVQAWADTLCAAGIIPERKLSPAANGKTMMLYIASIGQLMDIYNIFAYQEAAHKNFWDRYYAHITTPPIPYYVARGLE